MMKFGGISGTELSKKYGIPRTTIVKMAEQYRHKNNIKAPCRDLPARKWFNEDLQEQWDKTIAKFENVEYVKVVLMMSQTGRSHAYLMN